MKHLIFLLLFSFGVSAQTVYKTPSGSKYHRADCRTVKNAASSLSVSDAYKDGLTPCKICRPPTTVSRIVSKAASTSGEKATTTRCKGSTKQGNRCKRMTKIGDGYCFQHQP